MKYWLSIILISFYLTYSNDSRCQSLGGNVVFSFLNLASSAQQTALGGINISNITNDIGLSVQNPALLRNNMHSQLVASFNGLFAGIHNYSLYAGYYKSNWKTNFAVGANYFDYGTIPQTDPSGNILGNFHATDYTAQLSASRQYEKRWFYGASIKFIHSGYGVYRSSGIALDIGACYYDSSHLFQVAITLKNMGTQLKAFEGTSKGDLPFDLEIGATKRLSKAPLQFSLTAHHLQQFDINYNDAVFNSDNGYSQGSAKGRFTIDKLFRHFIVAAQVFPADKLEITVAYNYLRRKELTIGDAGNGLIGFSLGAGLLLKKLQLRYARSYYQNGAAYNHFSLGIRLYDYVGQSKYNN